MKLLYLVPHVTYDRKMSRVRFEEAAALGAGQPVVSVHYSGPGWPDWPGSARDYVLHEIERHGGDLDARPQAVLTYDGITGLYDIGVPVITIFHETYDFVKVLREIYGTGTTLALFTYANDLERYRHALSWGDLVTKTTIEHLPHGADETLYRDYGLKKEVDVLIVGNLAQDFYPFRARLARLARRELRKRGYRVAELPHPGFTLPPRPGSVVGEGYARWLNRSKLVLTCTGRHRYAFAKLVEIPLCRALPVSDLPAERQALFSRTVLNVEPWMMDREILARIEDVLDDEGLYERLVTQAHDEIARRLTLKHWAERFVWHLRRVLGESPTEPTSATIEASA